MNTRTVADIESWDRRPVEDGLGALADRRFSGAVRTDESYLFVVVGRPVGAFDIREDATGDLSTTETDLSSFDGSVESFTTPHDALPLLYAMQASAGKPKGRYYSNNTSIREVDRTLQEGGFTGYLELSENVLSGDYYLVYHGGTRRAVAFVGQSERLKTDEEAFDLAVDEVGIYNIKQVSLPTLSFPEAETETETETGVPGGKASTETTDTKTADESNIEAQPAGDRTNSLSDLSSGYGEMSKPADSGESTTSDVGTKDLNPDVTKPSTRSNHTTTDIDIDLTPRGTDQAPESESNESDASAGPGKDIIGADNTDQIEINTDDTTQAAEPISPHQNEITPAIVPLSEERSEKVGQEAKSQETRSSRAPAEKGISEDVSSSENIDPKVGTAAPVLSEVDTDEPDAAPDTGGAQPSVADNHTVPSGDPDQTGRKPVVEDVGERPDTAETMAPTEADTGMAPDSDTTAGQDRSELRALVSEREEALSARTSDLEQTREELAARDERLNSLRAKLSEATSRNEEMLTYIAELEDQLETGDGTGDTESTSLLPTEVLTGTSLFVRYRSKREPTLKDVQDGADSEAVVDNLRLEHHTQFDADTISVDGKSFETFISSIQPYKFVQWLICVLPYEIRDTGSATALEALYSAIPTLDRVEFATEVEVGDETVTFDLVARDRMGQPLVVVNLEDVREPTNAEQLGTLVKDATVVAKRHESLVAAFAVTSAYFEPAALETANEATGESLFSRSKQKSFVKLSRNLGFHIGLVEDRQESFYLAVPEL
jgi:hypothetical protein